MVEGPLFTAIVHTYNRPAYLKQAVGALRRQTYTNLEIILINNGGTPETIEYLRQAASSDDRVKLINFEENIFSWDDFGVYIQVCWNAALEAATGDYVWAQEDDDLIADDYAQKMVALFQDNPECTTAAGITVDIDYEGRMLQQRQGAFNFRPRYMPGHLLALDHLRGGRILFSAPSTVFTIRRDVLVKSGGYHRTLPLSEICGIVPFGVTGFDETAIFYLRRHEGQLNKALTARGVTSAHHGFALIKDWEIERRWQVFGKDMAEEIVSIMNRLFCTSAAERFALQIYSFRIGACLGIIRKMWTHRHFWLSVPHHARVRFPVRRWLHAIVKQVFRQWPGLADMTPRLATLRDRVNR